MTEVEKTITEPYTGRSKKDRVSFTLCQVKNKNDIVLNTYSITFKFIKIV